MSSDTAYARIHPAISAEEVTVGYFDKLDPFGEEALPAGGGSGAAEGGA